MEKLDEVLSKIKENLGEDKFAEISDPIAEIIASSTLDEQAKLEQQKEIERIRKEKENIIIQNGSLMKKIQSQSQEPLVSFSEETKNNKKSGVTYSDLFDEKGNLK